MRRTKVLVAAILVAASFGIGNSPQTAGTTPPVSTIERTA